MPSIRRRDERRSAESVRLGHVRIGAQDLVEHCHVPGLAEREEGIRAHLVLEVGVSARVDEDADRLCAARVDGRRHCGATCRIALVHIRTSLEQVAHGGDVAARRRLDQCGVHLSRLLTVARVEGTMT